MCFGRGMTEQRCGKPAVSRVVILPLRRMRLEHFHFYSEQNRQRGTLGGMDSHATWGAIRSDAGPAHGVMPAGIRSSRLSVGSGASLVVVGRCGGKSFVFFWSHVTSISDNVERQEATLVPVKTVGIRELKNRLSEHLREVRRGEHLLITDRGEVIAGCRRPGKVSRKRPFLSAFSQLPGAECLRLAIRVNVAPIRLCRV